MYTDGLLPKPGLVGFNQSESLSGIETMGYSWLLKNFNKVSTNLNPYQGLKQTWGMCWLMPLPRFNQSESLSGIETRT